jgi:hypothetical protein
MEKRLFIALSIVFAVLAISFVSCENISVNDSLNSSVVANVSINDSLNSTNEPVYVPNIEVIKLVPKSFSIGDVQFNIQVKNNQNISVSDVSAFVTGSGFSTYDIIPVDSLNSGERGYIVVSGNFRQAGNLTLTIKINSDVFYQNVSIIDSANQQKVEDDLQKEQDKQAILANISNQLSGLKENYSLLEQEIAQKKDDNYDVSAISLTSLKGYIVNTETNVLTENAELSKVNFKLASDEYADLKKKVDNVQEIPKISKFKDYAVIFSTLAGSIITFFALYELLKKKSSAVAEQVHSAKEKKAKVEDEKK